MKIHQLIIISFQVMNQNKIKTVHIHTDYKFVGGSNKFFGENFENTLFLYNTGEVYNGPYKDLITYFDWSDLDKVTEAIAQADLVVFYDLDVIKSRIALLIPENVKIMWRFFGYELYSRRRGDFLSDKSKQFSGNTDGSFPTQMLNIAKSVHGIIKFRGSHEANFQKALKRIDFMLVLCREEYNILLNYWPDLPEFIQLSHPTIDADISIFEDEFTRLKTNAVIIGNNRSSYNNHLDVMEVIDRSKTLSNYKFTLLFSYAGDSEYTDAVRKTAQGKEHYRLIEDFIPKHVFVDFYKSISALVINGYRQMAYGNIYLALKSGVKIYLNSRNPQFNWLKREGFQIYSMEEFETDLNNNNLGLDFESARYNIQNLKKFSSRYTKQDFQNKIRKVVLK